MSSFEVTPERIHRKVPAFHRKSQAAAAQIGRAEAVLARATSTEARLRDTVAEHGEDSADLDARNGSSQPQTDGEGAEARIQQIEASCRMLEFELERVETSGDRRTWLSPESILSLWSFILLRLQL